MTAIKEPVSDGSNSFLIAYFIKEKKNRTRMQQVKTEVRIIILTLQIQAHVQSLTKRKYRNLNPRSLTEFLIDVLGRQTIA